MSAADFASEASLQLRAERALLYDGQQRTSSLDIFLPNSYRSQQLFSTPANKLVSLEPLRASEVELIKPESLLGLSSLQASAGPVKRDSISVSRVGDPVIVAEGVITINNGGDFDGNPLNPDDDALIYGGKGFSINGKPILPIQRDGNGNPIVDGKGLPLLVDQALTVASGYSVFNAPNSLYSGLKTPQIVDKRFVEVPKFGDVKEQELSNKIPEGSVPVTFDAFRKPLNSAKDWTQYFPSSGTPDNPTVIRVTSQGLNIPSNVTLENVIILLKKGDINFNGQGHRLNNVVLVTDKGSINLSNVQATDLTVLAGRSINTGKAATFSGETLLANGNTNGITFNGLSVATGEEDFLTIISQGRVNYNADSDIRGKILSVGDISFNSNVDLTGSIATKGNIFFNKSVAVQAILDEEIPEPGLSTAESLGILEGTTVISDFVGDSDPVDFFSFSVNGLSNLVLTLSNLSADADVALVKDLNKNDEIDLGEIIDLAALEGTASEKIDVILTDGEYFVVVEPFAGDTNYNMSFLVTGVNEFPDDGQVSLANAAETSFNTVGQSVEFRLSGINPTQLPTIRAYHNDELVTSSLTITEGGIIISSLLDEGRNDIQIYGVQDQSFSLLDTLTLWAGNESIEATILDENGQPINGALVVARLADDQDVASQQVSDENGKVVFSNIPGRTILFEATDSENNFDSVGAIGNENQVTLVLNKFDEPSDIDNNDLSLGLAGWNVGNAPVELIPHQEPEFAANMLSLESALFSTFAIVNAASQPDIDLVLNTSGEGEQTISRTFTTEPGTKCVTLQYQFITSEIPGGFFGTEFNDYFSVSIRSLKGGKVVSETNSMNGLGLAAFNAAGETKFRELTLPVSEEGDTIQVDISVANIGDGILDSKVVIDSIDSSDAELEYENISLDFKGFIPSGAVSLTNKLFSFITPFPIFGGDNRGLSQSGSSRFTQSVTVTADPDEAATVKESERTWGTTTSYSSSQGNRVDGKPFWWWSINPGESPKASDTLPVNNSNNKVTVDRISDDTVKVNLKINGSNPLQFGAPKLDAELDVFIRQQSPCDTPEYKVSGFLDGFPAYELFINDQSVYGVSPEQLGNSPFSLLPGLDDITVSKGWQSIPK